MGIKSDPKTERRQWGADKRDPLPAVTAHQSDRSLTIGRLAILVTILAWAGYTITVIIRQFVSNDHQGLRFSFEAISYLTIVTALTFSALAYLVTRQGFIHRNREHRRVPRAKLDALFDRSMPTLTVLVPSYREDMRVVRSTLLSAALQEYPYMRITLLVDDPPHPTDPAHKALLEAARALPGEINDLLAAPSKSFSKALADFEAKVGPTYEPNVEDIRRVAGEYGRAAGWLNTFADNEVCVDHADRFFVNEVVRSLASDLLTVSAALHEAADDGSTLPTTRILHLYRRLAWTFQAQVSSFERKQYASLSNEPNKAMNLNSYIGLMGGSYCDRIVEDQRVLVPCGAGHSDLEVPDPDYVLTLDADSILLTEYCLRLVYLMEQEENERVAVAQTPYSAFPGSATRLERIAGASTDIQHIVHQGMTHYDATFWVGANAVIRKRALDDLDEVDDAQGWPIHRYVQDTTVIEDTESSIDLGVHGWTLHNYPERLSYSATPPDFGSLVIQRQRWADGGLIILPKLWRNARERRRLGDKMRMGEKMLRVNYLASICWASISLVLMLCYPYNNKLLSPLEIAAAVPYFMIMAGDLKSCGYKRTDVFRIYGFNLILLPVNLSGVFKSLQQAITGKKIPFARTPKVRNRTTTPLPFVVIPYLLVALSAWTLVRDVPDHRWVNAVFACLNMVLATYAIVAFLGFRNSLVDIWLNSVKYLYKPEKQSAPTGGSQLSSSTARPDWSTVLYNGSAEGHFDSKPIVPTEAAHPKPASDRPVAPSVTGQTHPISEFPDSIVWDIDTIDVTPSAVLGTLTKSDVRDMAAPAPQPVKQTVWEPVAEEALWLSQDAMWVTEEPVPEPKEASMTKEESLWLSQDAMWVTEEPETPAVRAVQTEAAPMPTPAPADRSEVNRSEVNRSEVNRSDVDRGDVDRGDVDRGDVDRGDVEAEAPRSAVIIPITPPAPSPSKNDKDKKGNKDKGSPRNKSDKKNNKKNKKKSGKKNDKKNSKKSPTELALHAPAPVADIGSLLGGMGVTGEIGLSEVGLTVPGVSGQFTLRNGDSELRVRIEDTNEAHKQSRRSRSCPDTRP